MSTEGTTPAAVPDEPVVDAGFLSLPAEVQQAAEALAGAGREVTDAAKARTLITGALLGELSRRLGEYENAISWNTSCLSCPAVLDSAYTETLRRERAEAKLAELRSVLLEGGQDAPSVRRRALAIISTEDQ